jgi:peptide/nickel transport system substrate-binding protein
MTTNQLPMRRLMIGLTILGSLTLAACSGTTTDKPTTQSPPADTSDREIDTLTFAAQSPPRSMDVAHANDYPSKRSIDAAFDRILALDNEGNVIPWIAESWTTPDPKTYVFTIRQDVTFWDGTPLTSADVAFSMQRNLDPDLGSETAGVFANLKSAVATDATTVTVKLKSPTPGFLAQSAVDWVIMSQTYAKAAGDDLGTPAKPGLGSGPYSITSYSASDGVTLERYDDYWGPAPKVKTLVIKAIEEAENARLALLADDIQGYFDVPLIATRTFDSMDNAYMTYVDGSYIDLLSMDVKRAPFDDPKVREAVAALVDREGLNTPLFNGKSKLATSILPAGQLDAAYGKDESAALQAGLPPVPAFDVEAAKAALAASTHPDGFTITLNVDRTQPWMLPLAQNMAENAKPLGIIIKPKQVSAAAWADELFSPDRGALQLIALGASAPDIALLPPLILGEGSINVAQYSTPELVQQLADMVAGSADDPAANTAAILAASNSSLAYLPLFDEQAAIAMSKEIVWVDGYSPWSLGQVWPLSIAAAE